MKITIYELLGLIKDGKAPKKIRKIDRNKHNIFLFYDEELKNYYDEEGYNQLFTDDIVLDLNDEVVIFFSTANNLREYIGLPRIEEDKKIEKIDDDYFERAGVNFKNRLLKDKINEIIDKLNEMGDK